MANNAEVSDQVVNEYVTPSMLNDTSDSTARFGEKGGTASTYLIAPSLTENVHVLVTTLRRQECLAKKLVVVRPIAR
jgi:hypothetical protein